MSFVYRRDTEENCTELLQYRYTNFKVALYLLCRRWATVAMLKLTQALAVIWKLRKWAFCRRLLSERAQSIHLADDMWAVLNRTTVEVLDRTWTGLRRTVTSVLLGDKSRQSLFSHPA